MPHKKSGFTPLNKTSSKIGGNKSITAASLKPPASDTNLTGFTLIELLVVISIIAILSTLSYLALSGVRQKARDTKRKSDLSQIGRILSAASCYLPQAGGGTYDLVDLIDELKLQYPQYQNFISQAPRDPKAGLDSASFYYYIVTSDGKKCALYANLENQGEKVTITPISSPTPGGGNGVFQSPSAGWNNSDKYYQVSN